MWEVFANQSENFDFCLTHSLCQIKIFSYDNKALSKTKKQCVISKKLSYYALTCISKKYIGTEFLEFWVSTFKRNHVIAVQNIKFWSGNRPGATFLNSGQAVLGAPVGMWTWGCVHTKFGQPP